jgi:transcription elongation factor GreA
MGDNKRKIYLTPEGFSQLQKEYQYLTTVKRAEVIQKLIETRELADLTENTLYDTALEEQTLLEKKISEASEILKNASLIQNGGGKIVQVGSKVRVALDREEQEFFIVDAPEVNPLKGKISFASPIGQALLGKTVGDTVEVDAPMGKLAYAILKVE